MRDDQDDEIVAINYAEITDSVAFSLVEELGRTKKITGEDAEYLRDRYKKLYEVVVMCRARNASLAKKGRAIGNEILTEKIVFEKVKLEESEEQKNLHRLEQELESAQKDFDFTGQRDIMAKFELTESKKIFEELENSLERLKQENKNLVEPVLTNLREQIRDFHVQLKETEVTEERENNQKLALLAKVKEIEEIRSSREMSIASISEDLEKARIEPDRLERNCDAIEKAAAVMDGELKSIKRKIKQCEVEYEKQQKKTQEAEKLQINLAEKIDFHRQTLQQREHDVSVVRVQAEKEKAKYHDLLTQKVELNMKIKEYDALVRHKTEETNYLKKDYDNLKRIYKKKRVIVDAVKQILPMLNDQLVDQEHLLRSYTEERERLEKKLQHFKSDMDIAVAQVLEQEGVEESKKKELNDVLAEVDVLEGEVVHWMAEEKRQSKLISVLSAQLDIKIRESTRVQGKEKDARNHVRMKELIILDLTKRCNELSNRLKEFSALYEVVKNERNKYVNLIQSSTQALAEMKEKIRILHNEIEILRNESATKDKALTKERTAHQNAQNQRDALRQEMNKMLAEYRLKQGVVEQQIQEIDKLNLVINTLEKEMLELKSKYESAVEERNVTGVQLIDRNDELCILYERSNQQQNTLKGGELDFRTREEDLRMVKLQIEEFKRHVEAAKKRLPDIAKFSLKITEYEDLLVAERKKTEAFSSQLEDPKNVDRWRSLEGEDSDIEQLTTKMNVLESRLDTKREQLLEKELILEEIGSLTERLRLQALGKRESAKVMADQLNDLQSKIRDTTKKMLATVSELSMYQATALRLQQEKLVREKMVDEAKWRLDHGEAPTEDAVRDWNRSERRRMNAIEDSIRREEEMQLVQTTSLMKSTAEPRPTAYIPDDLGIPKPYGLLAPFKPTDLGSTMKQHIRLPNPKPIEI